MLCARVQYIYSIPARMQKTATVEPAQYCHTAIKKETKSLITQLTTLSKEDMKLQKGVDFSLEIYISMKVHDAQSWDIRCNKKVFDLVNRIGKVILNNLLQL